MNFRTSESEPWVDEERPILARAELARIHAHKLFRKSQVLQRLLSFLVDAELQHQPVTESLLALALLGLAEDAFHPYTNSYVRVNTSLLRRRLSAYYQENTASRVRFHLPLGSFRLRIVVFNPSLQRWRRDFGQAKLLASSRYVDELEVALERIEKVVAEQPGFAPAYALKSSIHLMIGSHGGSPVEHAIFARQAAGRAMALAPDEWESLTAAANVAALLDWDWAGAEEKFDRAKAMPANEVVGDPWYQATQVAVNRIDTCLAQMRNALLDYPVPPRSLQQNYGAMLHLARRWEEAEIEFGQTTEIYPDDFCPWLWLAMQNVVFGHHAKAARCLIQGAVVSRGRMPGTIIQAARDFLLTGRFHPPHAHAGGAVEFSRFFTAATVSEIPTAT